MENKMHRERKLKILAFAEGVIKGLAHALQYNHVAPDGDIRWETDEKSGYEVCIQLHSPNSRPNCYIVYATPYEKVDPFYEVNEAPDVPQTAPTPLTIKYGEEVLVAIQLEADKPFVVLRTAKNLAEAYDEVEGEVKS